jgi:Domain of unknown function (DUF4276)
MRAEHFELLVEEPSMEAFLTKLLPKLFRQEVTFNIHAHQGKPDLLKKLQSRLRAYSQWLPETTRIIVLVDRDDMNCVLLKQQLEKDASVAGLSTRTSGHGDRWRVLNRIVIEELESWFFGHWAAVRTAFPKVPADVASKAAYRNCDAITGGTWEAFERVLNRGGYFSGGLRKVEAASRIGEHFDHSACVSPSFITFRARSLRRQSNRTRRPLPELHRPCTSRDLGSWPPGHARQGLGSPGSTDRPSFRPITSLSA